MYEFAKACNETFIFEMNAMIPIHFPRIQVIKNTFNIEFSQSSFGETSFQYNEIKLLNTLNLL